MAGAKKTEISIEFEEVVLIRNREHPVVAWCTGCHQRVSMLVAGDAARAAGVSARALYRLVETGRIHFTEAQDGSLLVCANSLGATPGRQLTQQLDQATDIDPAGVIDISAITEGEEHEE